MKNLFKSFLLGLVKACSQCKSLICKNVTRPLLSKRHRSALCTVHKPSTDTLQCTNAIFPGSNSHCHSGLTGKQTLQMDFCCVFIEETMTCCSHSACSEFASHTPQVWWWYDRRISPSAIPLSHIRLTLQLKPEVGIFQLGDCSNANFFRINRVHSLKLHILFKSMVGS